MAIVLPWEHSVCEECLRRNPHAIWLVKYKCFGGHFERGRGRKSVVIIDEENMELVRVRPPPDTILKFRGSFYLCRFVGNCPRGNSCVYAHTEMELDKWNATKSLLLAKGKTYAASAQSPSAVCSACYTSNPQAVWLTWLPCSKRRHTAKVTVVISNDGKQLVKVRNPPSATLRANPAKLVYHNDCGKACPSAHSEEERDYWRWLLVKKQMSEALASHTYGDVSFSEMCDKYSYPDSGSIWLPDNEELSISNYKSKYHKLVYLDNLEHARKMVADCDGEYTISTSHEYGGLQQGQVHITGMSSTAMDYVAQNTPPCSVLIKYRDKLISGSVESKKAGSSLVVSFESTRAFNFPFKAFVHFEYNHWYFWRLHRALHYASPALIERLVWPKSSRFLPHPQRRAANLKLKIEIDNEYQARALKKMLLCRPSSPFLLMGPFGTGKTHLLAIAITKLVLAQGNKILVCTHQNKGADHICSTLISQKIISRQVLRVCPDRRSGDLPEAMCVSVRDDNAMHRVASMPVTVTTFMTALRLKENDRHGQLRFTQIFIDEGAQSREPEALGALLMTDPDTHIIIAGDNKQVGPSVSVFSELARENGLGVSMLERLLDLYQSMYDKEQLNYHRHSLLTNYRCHPSILMLASCLSYECTLLSRSESEPHPRAPYPIVFQCSSLEQSSTGESSSTSEKEAEVLIKKAAEFIESWPQVKSKNIAILAGTAGQVAILRRLAQRKNLYVDITYTYTIQGSEYDAVFLSTHEPTDRDVRPLNTVRSICNKYVFNTVITRSRSLIFAVGNPFKLLKMSSHFSTNCWSELIQRCIACQSFHLPQSQAAGVVELPCTVSTLTEEVLPKELFQDLDDQDDDSESNVILTNYIDFLNKRPEYRHGIRLVQDPKQDKTTWQSDTEELQPSNIVLVELNLSTHHKGVIKPPNAPVIPVDSMRDRRCLFPGDKAPVDKTTNEIVCDEEREQIFNETHFGKPLLCRVNPRSMIEFLPLDKRYPKLINLPSLTKHEKNGVTCFDPSSMNDRLKVSNFIPKDQAVVMVFVVKVLRWSHKLPYPLGITVGALPCGNSIYSGDLLLRVAHHVPMADHKPAHAITKALSPSKRIFEDVLTIDPEGSRDHDDALSCVLITSSSDGVHEYEFGVHITDVDKFVPKDSDIDIDARQRGCSVYSSTAQCVSNMLPEEVVQAASILPGETRDAFSVIAKVSVKGKKVIGDVRSVEIVRSQVTSSSSTELTYESAQKQISASKGSRPIKTLLVVAWNLRQARLGPTAAAHLSVRRDDEITCPEAHMLVEELMIWANHQIAKELVNYSPMIFRRQPAPDEEKLSELVATQGQHLAVSLDLQQHVSASQECPAVQMLHGTVREMEAALREGSVRKALHLVQFEHVQPQVAVAHGLYQQICKSSSYCIPTDVEDYSHHGLNCEHYTRFTSPIRRYLDLVVQRILGSYLQGPTHNPYANEVEIVETMCREVREREKDVDKYENDRRSLALGCELQQSSREYMCFVKKVKDGRLFHVFSDPSLKLGMDATVVHLKYLNARKIPQKESSPEPDGDASQPKHCVWQVKMASDSCTPHRFFSSPHLQHTKPLSGEAAVQLVLFVPERTGSIQDANLQEKRINAAIKPDTLSVPGKNWRKLQEFAVSPPPAAASVKELLPSPLVQTNSKFPDISHSPLWIYELQRPLQSCEVLRVQLTGSFNRSTQLVSPSVQLLEVGPNLRVCIQHNSSPAECFTDTSSHSKPGHTSTREYFQFWERALLAEAATSSLTDAELMIITDVRLVWPKLRQVTDSQGQLFYQLPPAGDADRQDYCACLKLSENFSTSSYDFFSISEGDLTCVRCYDNFRPDGVRGVLHMVVHSIEKKTKRDGDKAEIVGIDVFLKFVGDRPNYISQQLFESRKKLAYEVQLMPLSLPFRRIYNSLKQLNSLRLGTLPINVALGRAGSNSSPRAIRKVLPVKQADIATSLWRSSSEKQAPAKLNDFQQKAVELACSRSFVMIQGPPGTGKSVTGAHIAYALAMKLREDVGNVRKKKEELNPCVMYCGPSQQSVNVVLDILTSSHEVQASGLKIVRVYNSAIESKDFPGPKSNPLVFREVKVDGKCEKSYKDYALHHIIRKRNQSIKELDEKFFQLKAENKIPSFSLRDKYKKAVTAESIAVLQDSVDIVLCTCNEAGSYRIAKSVEPVYCVIDECAMATEPECMVPIRRASNVVLIGDDKQLQPVLLNKDAMKMGMSTSLFERYCKAGAVPHMLRIQYRMHEALCKFPSNEFYRGELKTHKSVGPKYKQLLNRLNRFWPQGKNRPLVFCNVVGDEEENHTGHRGTARVGLESKRNTREARKIVEIAGALISQHKVKPAEIAVITPYSAQKEEIKKQLEGEEIDGITVKTITDSQGSEYGIVLLSTVRSLKLSSLQTASGEKKKTDFGWRREHLGFITDRHQICVGITRCKYGLAIIGNKELLSHDPTWEQLIQHYEEHGCVVAEEQFPPV